MKKYNMRSKIFLILIFALTLIISSYTVNVNGISSYSSNSAIRVMLINDCPDCHGSGFINCTLCYGKGLIDCPDCKGEGEIKVTCSNCKGNKNVNGRICSSCFGTGYLSIKCSSCSGKGAFMCSRCNYRGVIPCTHCLGIGEILNQ